ncbi:hypothetical protein [Luteipulveratus mongoliensis]|uniref:Uncharacterized protein n=1 Tax=Luteipulveratus mongoliensis TaxID=571913 RepID=A0A0K1JH84_9MICO|nr:hypothetical protein [Luteipulveratus mongoliensis]AKU15948.1 hypothetical protein VV02_08920 [Luteipulveratus mongoliensis]
MDRTTRQAAVPTPLGRRRFEEVLRDGITARGLALSRVREHLIARGQQIGVSTLSYWQNGERQPTTRSLPVIEALEQVLELSPGTLTSLVPTEADREPRRGKLAGITSYADTVDELIREMGSTSMGLAANLSTIEGVSIGRERSLETKHVHQVVRASEDVDRQVITYQGELGCDVTLLALLPVSGCRIGRVRHHEPTALVVAELLFDRTVHRHESHVFQYVIKDDNKVPTHEHYRMHLEGGGIHVVELTFHPEALPVRVEEFHRRRLEDPDARRRPVPIYHGNRVHLVTEPSTPGISGLSWEYD